MTKLRNGRDCFLIRFTDGSVHWGADLKRACELAGLKVGDTAELTLVAKQKAINSKGKEFTKTLWSARRLPSAEEIRAEEEKKAAVLEKRRLQMRALWKSSEPLARSNSARMLLNSVELAFKNLRRAGTLKNRFFTEKLLPLEQDIASWLST